MSDLARPDVHDAAPHPDSAAVVPPDADDADDRARRGQLPPDSRIDMYMVAAVWLRNRDVFVRLWKWLLLPNIADQALAMAALGFGIGAYVTGFSGTSYAAFIAPGLVCAAAMWSAGFECSYGTFFRMQKQRTFDAIIATPAQVEDVVLGELLYGAFRGAVSATLIAAMFAVFGLLTSPYAALLVPLAALIGFMVATIAVTAASRAPVIETLAYFVSFGLMPMFWLSGIFYEAGQFGTALEYVQWLSPLYHAVITGRQLAAGEPTVMLGVHLGVMVAVSVTFAMLAMRGMRQRLIR